MNSEGAGMNSEGAGMNSEGAGMNSNVRKSTAHDGRSKRERYGWVNAEKPGEFCWVNKDDLKVDHAYQRERLRAHTVGVVSRDWNWAAFGVLIVARRGSGLWIVDGQHRHEAALRRDDIQNVPCMIFVSHDQAHEALVFLASNTARKDVSSTEKHRAALTANDDAARQIDRMVTGAGWRVADMSGPKNFRVVTILGKLLRTVPEATLRVWEVVSKMETPPTERVLDALVYIETRLPAGTSLSEPFWAERILSIGQDDLHAAAGRAAALYAKGGAKVWSVGILDRLNKRLHARRLSLGES